MDAKIFVIYYKKGTVLKKDGLYQPLMCGGYSEGEMDGFLMDNVGDEISSKNPRYSELSGLYWVWKNTDHDVVGTCHYRRFYTTTSKPTGFSLTRLWFSLIGQSKWRDSLIYTDDIGQYVPKILTQPELKEILDVYDAVLPKPRVFRYSVREHYRKYHDLRDLEIIKELILDRCPDYLDAFENVLEGNRLYANNMFIMKRHDYQRFMEWWFDMLFAFEDSVDMESYTGYQERIIGFVAERLLTVWFEKAQLNCMELPLIYFKKFKSEKA